MTTERVNLGRLMKIYRDQCAPHQQYLMNYPYSELHLTRLRLVTHGKSKIVYNPNKRMGKDPITKLLKNLAQEAGIKNWNRVTIDTLRPFSMSVLANNESISPKMVADAARHSNLATQIFYVRSDAKQNKLAAEALSLQGLMSPPPKTASTTASKPMEEEDVQTTSFPLSSVLVRASV